VMLVDCLCVVLPAGLLFCHQPMSVTFRCGETSKEGRLYDTQANGGGRVNVLSVQRAFSLGNDMEFDGFQVRGGATNEACAAA
jgi:hypothetical protein